MIPLSQIVTLSRELNLWKCRDWAGAPYKNPARSLPFSTLPLHKCSRKYASSVASNSKTTGEHLPLPLYPILKFIPLGAPTAVMTASIQSSPRPQYHHPAVPSPRQIWATPWEAKSPLSCPLYLGRLSGTMSVAAAAMYLPLRLPPPPGPFLPTRKTKESPIHMVSTISLSTTRLTPSSPRQAQNRPVMSMPSIRPPYRTQGDRLEPTTLRQHLIPTGACPPALLPCTCEASRGAHPFFPMLTTKKVTLILDPLEMPWTLTTLISIRSKIGELG